MQRFRLLAVFAAAAVVMTLAAGSPARAQQGWGRGGNEERAERQWRREDWQEQQWRQHQWREREAAREWAWRNQQRWYQPLPYCNGSGCNFLR
jgi:hypothetical protein